MVQVHAQRKPCSAEAARRDTGGLRGGQVQCAGRHRRAFRGRAAFLAGVEERINSEACVSIGFQDRCRECDAEWPLFIQSTGCKQFRPREEHSNAQFSLTILVLLAAEVLRPWGHSGGMPWTLVLRDLPTPGEGVAVHAGGGRGRAVVRGPRVASFSHRESCRKRVHTLTVDLIWAQFPLGSSVCGVDMIM